MGVVGDRGAGPTSASSMMWNRGSAYSGVGTVNVPRPGSGVQATIRDAMTNGTGSYRDIDNALSAGGHSGNGSPQSAVVNSGHSGKNKGSSSSGSRRRSGTSSGGSGDSGGSGGFAGASNTSAKKALKYYEAPIAEKYGFSQTTAYQEALANTAYRREMADMRKAGLNPSVIYGSHNSNGADSNIHPIEDMTPAFYGGSGGGGGSGRRYRGGNSGKYAFSGGAYYGLMAAVGAGVSLATGNVGAGMAAAGLAGTAMKALNGFLKGM